MERPAVDRVRFMYQQLKPLILEEALKGTHVVHLTIYCKNLASE